MLVPRYWARTEGTATDPTGKRYRFQLWGWSQESHAEAQSVARNRLSQLVSRIGRGEPAEAYSYGKQPLREEILRALGETGSRGEAVVTRNRYGALVLNTAQVPFIDVDSPRVGVIDRLRGLFKRTPRPDPTLERIRRAARDHDRGSFRIYRTRAGFRVLGTDLFLDPRAASTRDLLAAFEADPHFTKLCKLQGSFRARLTPKPWRCGCPLPPGRHPREGEPLRQRFASWLANYETASSRFASCRYLESVGWDRIASEARAIVEEHDRVTHALSDLPLA